MVISLKRFVWQLPGKIAKIKSAEKERLLFEWSNTQPLNTKQVFKIYFFNLNITKDQLTNQNFKIGFESFDRFKKMDLERYLKIF